MPCRQCPQFFNFIIIMMTENKNSDTFSVQSYSDDLDGNSYFSTKFSGLWLVQFNIQCLGMVIQGLVHHSIWHILKIKWKLSSSVDNIIYFVYNNKTIRVKMVLKQIQDNKCFYQKKSLKQFLWINKLPFLIFFLQYMSSWTSN